MINLNEIRKKYENLSDDEFCQFIKEKTGKDVNIISKQEAKDLSEEYDTRQYNKKIFINSVYGALLMKQGFAMGDVDNARVITRGGRQAKRWVCEQGEKYARTVLPKKLAKKFNMTEIPEITGTIWTHGDTDSGYFQYDEFHKKFCPDMGDMEFLEMIESYMNPAFEKLLTIKAENERVPDLIKYPRELFLKDLVVTGKKMYIKKIIKKDDKIFDPPKTEFTGIELKKTGTPKFVKTRVMEGVDLILSGANKAQITDWVIKSWNEYKKLEWDMIARVQGIGKYDQGAGKIDEELPEAEKGATQSVKASMNYNFLLNKFKPGLQPLEQGNRVKYVSLKANIYNFSDIAWSGNCPIEFFKKVGIDVDREHMFNLTFNKSLCRLTHAMGMTKKDEMFALRKGLFDI